MVLKAKNLPGLENSKFAKKEFDGFFILFEVDQRWYNRDEHSEHYTLTMRSNSELLLKCPAWSYDLLFERDELEGDSELADVTDSLDNAHKGLSKNPRESHPRHYMYLKLEFKPPVRLSGEVLYANFDDKLEVPICGMAQFKSGKNYFVWPVARTDTEDFKRGKHHEEAGISAGSAMFRKVQGRDQMETGGT